MKLSKVFSVVMIAVMLVASLSNVAFAAGQTAGNAVSLDPSKLTGTNSNATSNITTMGQKIIGLIQTVGSVVAVIVLVVLGIKYMMGSAEEKAEYKKTLMPYVIGAILIFAASNVAGIVYSMANGL